MAQFARICPKCDQVQFDEYRGDDCYWCGARLEALFMETAANAAPKRTPEQEERRQRVKKLLAEAGCVGTAREIDALDDGRCCRCGDALAPGRCVICPHCSALLA